MNIAQPFHILVIDSDQLIVERMERIAEQAFPEARFFGLPTPQDVLHYFADQPIQLPQLILFDIALQQPVHGLGLLAQLHQRLKGQVPIIVLTTVDSTTAIRLAYQTGSVAYTQKPTDLQGWQHYIAVLRSYWYRSTLLPTRYELP